jgi:hypothetical protein
MNMLPSLRVSAEVVRSTNNNTVAVEGFVNPDGAFTKSVEDTILGKASLTVSLTTLLLLAILSLVAGAILCSVLLPTAVAFVKHIGKFFKNG